MQLRMGNLNRGPLESVVNSRTRVPTLPALRLRSVISLLRERDPTQFLLLLPQ